MKKLIALLSVLALTVLASCGKNEVIINEPSGMEIIENNDIINDELNIVIGDEIDNSTTEEEVTSTGVTSTDEISNEDIVIEVM